MTFLEEYEILEYRNLLLPNVMAEWVAFLPSSATSEVVLLLVVPNVKLQRVTCLLSSSTSAGVR